MCRCDFGAAVISWFQLPLWGVPSDFAISRKQNFTSSTNARFPYQMVLICSDHFANFLISWYTLIYYIPLMALQGKSNDLDGVLSLWPWLRFSESFCQRSGVSLEGTLFQVWFIRKRFPRFEESIYIYTSCSVNICILKNDSLFKYKTFSTLSFVIWIARAYLDVVRLDGPSKLPSTAWNIALDTCVENGELEKACFVYLFDSLSREVQTR